VRTASDDGEQAGAGDEDAGGASASANNFGNARKKPLRETSNHSFKNGLSVAKP
jgi:hypothetical protein